MNTVDDSEVQDAFNKVSNAISELEGIIRQTYDTPLENIDITTFKKIKLPKRYIRTVDFFYKEYNLRYIINDEIRRKNIVYALMQSDFYNYLINRLEIFATVQGLLYKMAIVNNVSIIEALIICSLSQLHLFCLNNGDSKGDIICTSNNKCGAYINKTSSLKFGRAIEIFNQHVIDDSGLFQDLHKLNDIRNNIHISLVDKSEFFIKDYNLKNYNLSIRTLNKLKINQLKGIEDFQVKQRLKCLTILPF